jgi:hypothetical protein
VQTLEPEPPRRVDAAASSGRALRITGLAIAGAGVVSAAIGGYYTSKWMNTENAADKAVTLAQEMGMPISDDEVKRRYGHGYDEQRRQDIAYIVAGGLVIGGAVTYWLGHRKDRAVQTTAWTPAIGAGFAGIAISGPLP